MYYIGLHKLFGEQLQKAWKKRRALRDSQPGNLTYTQWIYSHIDILELWILSKEK